MLQIWFLYFWPKEETCTVFVFKLVEVSQGLKSVRGNQPQQDQGIDNPGKEN